MIEIFCGRCGDWAPKLFSSDGKFLCMACRDRSTGATPTMEPMPLPNGRAEASMKMAIIEEHLLDLRAALDRLLSIVRRTTS